MTKSTDAVAKETNTTMGVDGCPACGRYIAPEALRDSLMVCPLCGYHHPLGTLQRISQLVDNGSWEEIAIDGVLSDPLDFFDSRPYPARLKAAQLSTGLPEAFAAGRCTVEGVPVGLGILDFQFLGGSMGAAVGEGFWRLTEHCIIDHVPLVVVTSSGGARMQEGLFSLLQMAKTVMALEELRETAIPFLVVLADPTTGGVLASFASLADVIIAEPGAQLWFTGPRVREMTTRERTPEGFGSAEEALKCGHVDLVVPRAELRQHLVELLILLQGGESVLGEIVPQRRKTAGWRAGEAGRAAERVAGVARAAWNWLRRRDR